MDRDQIHFRAYGSMTFRHEAYTPSPKLWYGLHLNVPEKQVDWYRLHKTESAEDHCCQREHQKTGNLLLEVKAVLHQVMPDV